MTIDKCILTNFTLEALQNVNINRLVFEACMERVEYDGVTEEKGGKVLRLRDTADNDLIEINSILMEPTNHVGTLDVCAQILLNRRW